MNLSFPTFLCLFFGAVLFLLASCTHYSDHVAQMDVHGGDFHHHLAREYRTLALVEAEVMYDWADAEYFATKALQAVRGEYVEPSLLEQRHLGRTDDKIMAEVRQARRNLMQALKTLDVPENAKSLARAQARFDCWLEQLEEHHQTDHILDCRNDHYAAMESLIRSEQPRSFIVFFKNDSADLTPETRKTLKALVHLVGPHDHVSVVGYTDTTGTEAHNKSLSQRRADAVRAALAEKGLAGNHIKAYGHGQNNPLVRTDDQTPEPKNRRAIIRILSSVAVAGD